MTEEESRYASRLARTIESTGALDKVALGEIALRWLKRTSHLITL